MPVPTKSFVVIKQGRNKPGTPSHSCLPCPNQPQHIHCACVFLLLPSSFSQSHRANGSPPSHLMILEIGDPCTPRFSRSLCPASKLPRGYALKLLFLLDTDPRIPPSSRLLQLPSRLRSLRQPFSEPGQSENQALSRSLPFPLPLASWKLCLQTQVSFVSLFFPQTPSRQVAGGPSSQVELDTTPHTGAHICHSFLSRSFMDAK